jgi:cytochrome c
MPHGRLQVRPRGQLELPLRVQEIGADLRVYPAGTRPKGQPVGWLDRLISMEFLMKKYSLPRSLSLLGAAVMLSFAAMAPAHAEFDAESAQTLAKKNDCFKCHAIDKTKKGPSFKKISAKYKGKPEGQDKAIKNMTEGKKVKLEDGTEEDHKIIDTKDQKELKNLADWILSH